MNKVLILLFLIPLFTLAQTDNAESYSGGNYTDENQGTGWTGNFTFKNFGVTDNGGEYIESGTRKISGSQSFALYANNTGTGKAVSRSFSSEKTGLTRITFRIRFDLNTSNSKSAGIVLNSTATGSQTNWNDGQRLYVGISGDGKWKYDNGTLTTIRNSDNSADYICTGGNIYLVTIDFDVRSSGTFGNDKFCMKIVNESDGNAASQTLTSISLGGTANSSIKSIGFGNGVVGSAQNLIWDDIETTDNPPDPLPVELTTFSAKLINGIPNLSWQTVTEVNNYGFDIERSTDKAAWNKIGFVQGAGNSNSPKNYSYTDNTAVSGKYFYRLKQLDTDGTFDYSPVAEVDMGILPGGYRLEQNYPNPFNPSTSIKFAFSSDTKAAIKVYNALGVEVREIFNGVAEAGRVYDIQFNAAGLSSGVYYYKLITPEKTDVRKMMLTK